MLSIWSIMICCPSEALWYAVPLRLWYAVYLKHWYAEHLKHNDMLSIWSIMICCAFEAHLYFCIGSLISTSKFYKQAQWRWWVKKCDPSIVKESDTDWVIMYIPIFKTKQKQFLQCLIVFYSSLQMARCWNAIIVCVLAMGKPLF